MRSDFIIKNTHIKSTEDMAETPAYYDYKKKRIFLYDAMYELFDKGFSDEITAGLKELEKQFKTSLMGYYRGKNIVLLGCWK